MKSFFIKIVGDRLEMMNDNTRREEKIVLNDTVMPEKWSPFYNLTTEDSYNLWIKIIRAAERYADLNFTDDTWLTVAEHNNFDHDNLGIGLRIVNMNIPWSNASNEYRNNEWNNFIITATDIHSHCFCCNSLRTNASTVLGHSWRLQIVE